MWELSTWYLVGAVGLIFTAVSLLGLRDNIVALFVADAASVLVWIMWSINAFAVEKTTESGIVLTQNYPSLGYLGFAFAVLMLLDLFASVFESMVKQASEATNG